MHALVALEELKHQTDPLVRVCHSTAPCIALGTPPPSSDNSHILPCNSD